MEWNKKLAAEYRASASKIKGRIDELTTEIKARQDPRGYSNWETDQLRRRRNALYKMYGDALYTAHILEHYYVDK